MFNRVLGDVKRAGRSTGNVSSGPQPGRRDLSGSRVDPRAWGPPPLAQLEKSFERSLT